VNLTASSEPTPAEDAAARAKEKEEQAALPYKWTQTIGELDITFTVPANLKSRDLAVDIKKQKLVAGIKGQEPIISVCFFLFPLVVPTFPRSLIHLLLLLFPLPNTQH